MISSLSSFGRPQVQARPQPQSVGSTTRGVSTAASARIAFRIGSEVFSHATTTLSKLEGKCHPGLRKIISFWREMALFVWGIFVPLATIFFSLGFKEELP